MKTLLLALLLTASAFGQTQTFSSRDATRLSTSTGLVDFWQVKTGSGRLISLFGLNTGAQQYVQVFDSTNGPTFDISGFSASAETMTNAGHMLKLGEAIQLTGTVAGASAGIYYASPVTVDTFYIYDTKAHAITAGATGKQNLTGSSASATLQYLPTHTFAVAAADNYSCIVPSTGILFNRGLVVAVSTTGPLYTAGAKEITALVTLSTP